MVNSYEVARPWCLANLLAFLDYIQFLRIVADLQLAKVAAQLLANLSNPIKDLPNSGIYTSAVWTAFKSKCSWRTLEGRSQGLAIHLAESPF